MSRTFIGVDFGTSIIKATAISEHSHEIKQVAMKYDSLAQKKSIDGWSFCFKKIIKLLLLKIPSNTQIEAISITGMVPNVALVDDTSGKLIDSILFFESEAYDIELELDEKLRSAKWANEVLSKLIKTSRNTTSENYKWFTTHSWLVYELSGAFVIDAVTAGECGSIINDETGTWDTAMLNSFGINMQSVPTILPILSVAGTVKDNYEIKELVGAKLIVGTSDTIATAIGAGWNDVENTLLIYYGTFNCAAQIQKGRNAVLYSNKAYNPFNWILSVPRAGDQLASMSNMLSTGKTKSLNFKVLDDLASQSIPGANGLIYLHAENLDATTVSSEPVAMIRNLRPSHTKADMARAVLEGFGYMLRRAVETNGKVPQSFRKVISAGGGARSQVWLQMVSDITGLSQNYQPEADRGLGSALLAMLGVSPEGFVLFAESLTSGNLTITPDPKLKKVYDVTYQKYLDAWIK